MCNHRVSCSVYKNKILINKYCKNIYKKIFRWWILYRCFISTFVLINLWLYLIHLLERKCLNPIFRIYLLFTAVKNKHKSDKICIIIRLISLQKYLQCMQMPARTPWHLQRKFCKHSWQTRVEAKWWPKCSGVQGPYPQGGIHLDSPRTILRPGESRWLCMCKHQDSGALTTSK